MGNCPAEGPQFEAPNFLFHFCLFQWWSQRSNYVATVMAICLACKESSAGWGRPRQKPGAACRLRSQHQSSEQEKRTIACSSGLMVLKLLEGLYVSIWEWNKTQQVYTSWLWRRFEIGIWLEPGWGRSREMKLRLVADTVGSPSQITSSLRPHWASLHFV